MGRDGRWDATAVDGPDAGSFESFLSKVLEQLHSPDPAQRDEALGRMQERMNQVLGVSSTAMLRVDPDAQQVVAVRSTGAQGGPRLFADGEDLVCTLPGLSKRLQAGESIAWMSLPDDVPEDASIDRAWLHDHRLRSVLSVPLKVSGELRWALLAASTWDEAPWIRPPMDRFAVVGQLMADAMQAHRAQAALAAREARFRTLFETAGIGILIHRPDARVLAANECAGQLFGTTPDRLVGQVPWDFAVNPEATRARAEANIRRALQGETVEFEWRGRNLQGQEFIAEIVLTRAHLDDGLAVQTVLRDVTARRLAEARVERLAAAMEQSQDSVLIADPDGRVEFSHRASPESRLPSMEPGLLDHLGADLSEEQRNELHSAFEGHRAWSGRVFREADQGTEVRDLQLYPLRNEAGFLTGWAGTSRDVTERVRLQEQLQHTQTMQAIGTLAGGIAHDFNNLLGVIMGHAELARDELGSDSVVSADIDQVLNASRRASKLVRQILTLSRRSRTRRSPVFMAQVVREAVGFMRASLPATVELRCRLPDAPVVVMADATEIHQVVMNLCTNAAQSFGLQGGVIRLTLEVLESGEEASPRGGVSVLTVSDDGPGMPPEVLRRCFEPFFSTKAPGLGTGLGLAVVHGVVTNHGGDVQVSSREGEGTTFSVRFPLAENPGPAGSEGEEEAPVPRRDGLGKILVVDDEPDLAHVSARMLRAVGYEATPTCDPRGALQMVRENPEAFDGVVTDLAMPGCTGVELLEALRQVRPGLPVVLASGHHEWLGAGPLPADVVLLDKPFTLHSVAEAVHRSLVPGTVVRPGG